MAWPKGKPRKKKIPSPEPIPVVEAAVDLARGEIGPHTWTVRKDEWGRQIITVRNSLGDVIREEQRKLVSVEKQVADMVGAKEEAHAYG